MRDARHSRPEGDASAQRQVRVAGPFRSGSAGWQERSTFIEQDGRGFITSISNGWNPTCIVFSPFTRRLFERP
jgi:hypothetical protein